MSDSKTSLKGGLVVGLGKAFLTVATTALVVYGGLELTGRLDYTNVAPRITGTGTTSTEIVFDAMLKAALTATGGTPAYDLLRLPWPETFTGVVALGDFCLDTEDAPQDRDSEATFVDIAITSSGAAAYPGTGGAILTIATDHRISRGTTCWWPYGATNTMSGSFTIPPDHYIVIASSNQGSGTGDSLDSELHLRYRQSLE